MAEISDGIIKRMRNLKLYQGKSDDEIRAMMAEKQVKDALEPPKSIKAERTYDTRFKEKIDQLQDEFAVDMNDANDREMLSSLVRHQLQSEAADETIRSIYQRGSLDAEDFRNLKNLGDMQRSIAQTITDLQDRLGISRKLRKEKQTDDIPQWVDSVLERAKTMFDRQTVKVECPRCRIELMRYWLNFPQMKNEVDLKLTCWKCEEVTVISS